MSPIFPCWESPPTKDHLFLNRMTRKRYQNQPSISFGEWLKRSSLILVYFESGRRKEQPEKYIFHSLFLFYFITLKVFIHMFVSIKFTLFDIDLYGQVWQRRRKISWGAGTSCGLMYRLWREPSLGWHKFDVSPQRNPKYQNLCSALSLFAEDKVLRVG